MVIYIIITQLWATVLNVSTGFVLNATKNSSLSNNGKTNFNF